MRKDLRRQTILLAATQACAEGGPEGLSMERVASNIGVSRAVLYDHFPSRSALMVAIHDDYARFVHEKVSAAVVGHDGDLTDLAAASIRGFFDAVAERGIFNRMLVRAAAADPAMQDSQIRLRRDAIESTVSRVRPLLPPIDDRSLRLVVAMTISLAEQAATLWLAGDCTRQEAEMLYTKTSVPALRALASRAPLSTAAHL